MEIKWVGSPNFSSRNGRKPIAIVNHITSGAFNGALSWLCNPKAQASAHYLISRDGQIVQLVKDEDKAWHAGEVNHPHWRLYDGSNPNLCTIGIEHEGYTGAGGDGNLTEEQYQATLFLQRHLIEKWGVPVDRDYIIGHYRIDSVNRPNCPGPKFPWERLFNDLLGGGEEQVEPVKIIMNGKELDGVIIKDHSYVPVVSICEVLGKKATWDEETRTVTVSD